MLSSSLRLRSPRVQGRWISSHVEEWTKKATAELKGKDPSGGFETPEGITLERFYSPDHNAEVTHHPPPGVFPYARGPYATMYTARPWTVRQYAGNFNFSRFFFFLTHLLS